MAFKVGDQVLVFVSTPYLGEVVSVSGGIYSVRIGDTVGNFSEDELYEIPRPKTRMMPKRSTAFYWVVQVIMHGGDFHIDALCYTWGGSRIDVNYAT